VTTYERSWVGESDNPFFPGESETCLRLDTAIQLCESWAEPYHDGLVDVPMSMYENSTDTEVLLVGGGDWIAVNHLRKHGASVDQVDIDGEFMDEAKTDSLLRRYHEGAYEYEHLDTYRTDIYKYLQRTDTKYDLVLLDLPGAKSDALSHLYSTEFYSLLRSHLSDQGVVTTWIYSPYGYPAHNKAYVNTVRDAGFDYQLEYTAYSDYNEDGELQRGERFVMFAPENDRSTIQPANGSAYVARFADRYEDLEWRATPRFNGVRVHSVFHPNYEIIIDRP
jgi:spermidine synthase